MDPLTISAASGLRSRMESLDMLANNLANTETGGYKTDREFYSLFTASDTADPGAPDPTTVPVIESNWTDFSQGTLRQTANPTDLALQGSGFFAVQSPSGPLYTRNGAFQVTKTGTLATADGYPVRSSRSGAPLTLDSAVSFEVAADGSITQAGRVVGKLEVVDFDKPQALSKQGNTFFRNPDPKIQARPAAAQVHQGKIEGSNVGSAESAVRLVSLMRQFEMLQRAVTIGSDMNKQAIQEVARVGS